MSNFNKEEIRKQMKDRNDKARNKFKRGMVILFGEDLYKKTDRAIGIMHEE